jgi:hypothetical protein
LETGRRVCGVCARLQRLAPLTTRGPRVTGTARSMSRVRVAGLDVRSRSLRMWSVRGPHTGFCLCAPRLPHSTLVQPHIIQGGTYHGTTTRDI